MGGDFGPRLVVPACVSCLQRNPSLSIILVGQSELIEPLLHSVPSLIKDRLSLHSASEVVAMDEPPAQLLRCKSDSSMRVALELVRDGVAQACISAGNTGALMALSKHVLKKLPDIERPAIMTSVPTLSGQTYLLDLGANLDCSAQQLAQFARMGSAAVQLSGVVRPKVALLNVGLESNKGNQQVRAADELLRQQDSINYIGYVEGDGVYRGEADVVVCDGFVGNVFLKTSEGLARMLAQHLSQQNRATLWRRLLALLNLSMWRQLRRQWSPDSYNGAWLLGVNGIVIKSHGAASEQAFAIAVEHGLRAVEENLVARLQAVL